MRGAVAGTCLAALQVLGGLAAGPAWADHDAARLSRERLVGLSSSVLRIEVLRSQGGYALGSGVVLAEGRIVTNCHVTRDAEAVYVQRGGVRWRAHAQAAAPELDLCVLRVPEMIGTPVDLRLGPLREGESLAALGYVGGLGLQAGEGQVVSLHRHAGGAVVQASTFFNSGASGGGLFDAEARLVGVLSFRLRGGESHYFAAPTAWLAPLLVDESRYEAVAPLRPVIASYWEAASERQPRFLRAAVLEQSERWDALESLAGEWLAADPSDPEAYFWQGRALQAKGRHRAARAALEQATRLAPDWDDAFERLGLSLVASKDAGGARRILDRLRARRHEAGARLAQALHLN